MITWSMLDSVSLLSIQSRYKLAGKPSIVEVFLKLFVFDNKYLAVQKKKEDGEFIAEYIFTKKERKMEEFYTRCNYHQVSKESHFTQKRICSLPTEKGRITLTGMTLKITEKGVTTETQLDNEMEVQQVLSGYFGIKL